MEWKQALGWRKTARWARSHRKLLGGLGVGVGIAIMLVPFILLAGDVRIPVPFLDRDVNVPGRKLMLGVGAACFVFGVIQLRKQKK